MNLEVREECKRFWVGLGLVQGSGFRSGFMMGPYTAVLNIVPKTHGL